VQASSSSFAGNGGSESTIATENAATQADRQLSWIGHSRVRQVGNRIMGGF
jgi:hypothetical protein